MDIPKFRENYNDSELILQTTGGFSPQRSIKMAAKFSTLEFWYIYVDISEYEHWQLKDSAFSDLRVILFSDLLSCLI